MWTIGIIKYGSLKGWQKPNACQIAKLWFGKVWLGTKHPLKTKMHTRKPQMAKFLL
jgi:hypothetical protein